MILKLRIDTVSLLRQIKCFWNLYQHKLILRGKKIKSTKALLKEESKQPLTVIKVIAIIFINLEHLTVKKNFEIKIKALSKEKTKHNY